MSSRRGLERSSLPSSNSKRGWPRRVCSTRRASDRCRSSRVGSEWSPRPRARRSGTSCRSPTSVTPGSPSCSIPSPCRARARRARLPAPSRSSTSWVASTSSSWGAAAEAARRGLLDPTALVARAMQRRDDLEMRLRLAQGTRLKDLRSGVEALRQEVLLRSPLQRIQQGVTLLPHLRTRLQQRMKVALELGRRSLEDSIGTLHALSPLAILGRGYSITRRWPELTVLRAASAVAPGDVVHVRLAAGELLCEVQKTANELIRESGSV